MKSISSIEIKQAGQQRRPNRFYFHFFWGETFLNTLRETNSAFAPENGWLEDDSFLFGGQKAYFEGRAVLLVSGRV